MARTAGTPSPSSDGAIPRTDASRSTSSRLIRRSYSSRRAPLRSRCALVLGILAVLGSARAQEPVDRPAAAERIVAQFDFDKPEPFSIPRYWDLAQDGSKAGGVRPGLASDQTAM